jgi:hypothetical protein
VKDLETKVEMRRVLARHTRMREIGGMDWVDGVGPGQEMVILAFGVEGTGSVVGPDTVDRTIGTDTTLLP